MGRGGARKYPKADVCTYSLGEAWKDYVRNTGLARSFELSPYGHVHRSSAVNGRGLVKALDMITACYEVENSLQFKFSTLKEALQSVHNYYGSQRSQSMSFLSRQSATQSALVLLCSSWWMDGWVGGWAGGNVQL